MDDQVIDHQTKQRFSRILLTMGVSLEAVKALRDYHGIQSFQQLRHVEDRLHWGDLDHVPKDQQPRMKFIIIYIAKNSPDDVNFDTWVQCNEFTKVDLDKMAKEDYPTITLPPKFIRKWLQDKKNPSPHVMAVEPDERRVIETFHLRESPDLSKCTVCGNCYDWRGGLRKCSGCEKVAYCSYHCQMIHWKGGHKRFCGK